uniref:Uncharacterized protein n=1 Tax=Oxytricha trifallax TaxID=1172189 RepID=G9HRF7_9SPIT|nr:hypothetical protein [Oxytricha trifallax]
MSKQNFFSTSNTKLKKQVRFNFFHNKSSKLYFPSKRSYRKLWTNKYFIKRRKLKQFLYKIILKKIVFLENIEDEGISFF